MTIGLLTKIAATTLGIFLMAGTGAALASVDHELYIEDAKVELSQSLKLVDGWTYAPVRELAEKMGWELGFEEESGRITVKNEAGDILSFRTGQTKIGYNGIAYELEDAVLSEDGNAYFPLRALAEAMHAQVGWRDDEDAPELSAVEEHVVAAGDTLWSIAQEYGTSVQALQIRNGITDDSLAVGLSLKVVVPEFMLPKPAAVPKEAEAEIDQAELTLLAKLVQVEAGYEPYEGKLAVASVVMNRVKNPNYPNTLKGVIYAPGQFSPARNGKLDKATPSKESIKAAKAALSGENNVPGAVYFFNPKLEPAKLKKVKVVAKIGNHVFAK